MLRLLHLSDIHFHPAPGAPQRDVDLAVRRDLLTDLRELGPAAGDVDAILVVGDLAAKGKPEEFELAREFLAEACEIVDCAPTAIGVVPGNHDIDRAAHTRLHDGLRRLLRTEPPERIAVCLEGILSDCEASSLLHAPFEAYNEFAHPYGFAVTADQPVPPPWDLDLGSHTLRIRSVNTSLVCDGSDGAAEDITKVVLGMGQLVALADDHDVITVLMCHHPLNWLRDAEQVAPWLARPHILLTGHEHTLGITPDPDGLSLTIASGAVNPEKTEPGWSPAYNIIDLDTNGDTLTVSVRVRTYGKKRAGFAAEPGRPDPDIYTIPLGRKAAPTADVAPASKELPPVRSGEREMIFEIVTASPDARERAGRRLDLLRADERLTDEASEVRLIAAMRKQGLVNAMHEEIVGA
jgi:predicted phosphodiesterase